MAASREIKTFCQRIVYRRNDLTSSGGSLMPDRDFESRNPLNFQTKGTHMNPLKKLAETSNDAMLTALRLVLGIIFLAHGAQLTFGMFGGHGLWGSISFFTAILHIPAPLAFVAIMAEFAGGLALMLGLASRLAALAIAVNMVVAVAMVHGQYGLFMNWFGNQKGEGFEYHLLAIAVALPVIVRGGGAFSADRLIVSLAVRDLYPHAIPFPR
jgi:putative oxidoreductase